MNTLSSIQKLVCALAILVPCALFTTCSPSYVIRAGIEEARILGRRRPISDVLADPSTPPEVRRKLQLVLQARAFAEDQLDLAAAESYTTYSWVDSDTLLMVVSAARKDRFEPYLWWFPIVGHVPYKGYFDFDRAYAEARRLDRKGYDTNVRPSAAFSTLGWFNDPLLNTLLRYGDVGLAETVVHEITHNSLYLPGQAGFNESFANFVGDRGAAVFFCTRDGAASDSCTTAMAAWQDNIVFGNALTRLVAGLEAVYNRADLTTEQKIEQRAVVFRDWAAGYKRDVVPQLKLSFRRYADEPLNNARLIGTRLYYQRLDLFDRVFQKYNGDMRAAAHAIIAAAKQRPKDPFGAVEALLR
ncbi:MAG TPA: aminopeptidase [Longimicrobiales bacterium]